MELILTIVSHSVALAAGMAAYHWLLKNNRARAVRFSTLTAICEVLDCEVGDVLRVDRS